MTVKAILESKGYDVLTLGPNESSSTPSASSPNIASAPW